MGWSIRKSFSVAPGVRINLSRKGPRISVGGRGARASFGVDGKTRLYGGAGPVRYQKTLSVDSRSSVLSDMLDFIRRLFRE